MIATSYESMGARALEAQEEARGILDPLLHLDKESDGLAPVDQAVVVGQRQVHHRADDDLAGDRDRALVDRVHAEDGALGRVYDRRREERAERPPVRYREDAALEVAERDLPLAGLARRVRDRPFDRGHPEAVAAA